MKSLIFECYHLFIPKLTNKSIRYPKWFNSNLIHQSNHVKYLRKKANTSPTVHNVLTLQKAELGLANQTSSAKKDYETQLVKEFAFRNSSPIFKYIRSFSKQVGLPSVMSLDTESESSSHGKADLFNKFFSSVFTTNSLPQKSIHAVNDVDMDNSMISFEEEDVFQYLSRLDPAKAMGIDNIPNLVLKYCSQSLCSPIHHLFQQCVKQGYLPNEWRIHKIIPIYKSGDKSSVKNYRPISLLCCISKVLESIIYDQIYDTISSHISTNQFGFLRQRSTVQQLLKFTSTIHEAFNRKSQVDTIYFDIRKAFDSVSHGLLLDRLVDIGTPAAVWKFMKAYLDSRQQCVCVDNNLSSFLPVSSGVPQGSILGPLLFLIYANDLSSYISKSKVFIYADDTKLCHEISCHNDFLELQADIDNLVSWSSDFLLSLHPDKTFFISFRSSRLKKSWGHCYLLNGNPISSRISGRDLGVNLSSDLSWSLHIQKLLQKAYRSFLLIRRTFPPESTPTHIKKHLYLALVLPLLTYASPVWRPKLLKDIIALESFQRRATKYILNFPKSTDYKSRLTALQILPIMYRLELNDIMFYVTSKNNPSPHFNISDYILEHSSSISTRSQSAFKLIHMHSFTNTNRHFYFNRLPRLWNSLPPLDPNLSISTIKIKIVRHLIDHFLNHFDSYNPCTFHLLCPCNSCSSLPIPTTFTE